jgi:hypothetical protein
MPGGGQESAPLLQTRDANHEEVCYLHFAVSDVIGITVSGIVVGGFPFRRCTVGKNNASILPLAKEAPLVCAGWQRKFDRSAVKPPLKGQAGRPRFREAVMEE